MPKLSKAQREQIYAMFDGRCAYCGCELSSRWHADHVEPIIRVGSRVERPENDRFDNFMPSCAPCNIDKHRMNLENWREWLAVRLAALRKQAGFKLLSAHGLIAETGAPVVFHFERVEAERAHSKERPDA